ncbi:transglutaminase-like domain-containing protein [Actinomadura litoris]|uniref:Transglutaminase n=1 Tax=Actinomadura litoris TaxID=2678616 RepID=A0A7K1L7A5_9ACTN|nr:transglutaminase family protein [Actinomadura litoris]MUN40055.1 transglutaminase [Actinomadura litoris]
MDFDARPWEYLGASEAIDIEHPLVQTIAARLRNGDDLAYAEAAFDHVRDEITHSLEATAWRASDALDRRTGLCFAKAHAYVALLRAGGIQAGLCYQRLDGGLHGLAAVLADDRWVHLDPRGTDLAFSASEDRLAYPDAPVLPMVHAAPPRAVLDALKSATLPTDLG